jgi:hypothetical protein
MTAPYDAELAAMRSLASAVGHLDQAGIERVLNWAYGRFAEVPTADLLGSELQAMNELADAFDALDQAGCERILNWSYDRLVVGRPGELRQGRAVAEDAVAEDAVAEDAVAEDADQLAARLADRLDPPAPGPITRNWLIAKAVAEVEKVEGTADPSVLAHAVAWAKAWLLFAGIVVSEEVPRLG